MNEIVDDGAWCWFADPRALYHAGRIFYGYVDSNGWIWVGEVETATWTRRRSLIAADTQVDDHNNPTLAVRGGRLVVFWCGHSGPSMRYRVANNADTIDGGFGPVIVHAAGNTPGGNGFTYPSPAQMSHDGALHLFWRGGNFQPVYSKTAAPNGVGSNQWTPARHLFSVPGNNRPYLRILPDGGSVVRFLLTDGHPHVVSTSIYYAELHLSDSTIRRADGSLVRALGSTPVPVATLDRVYDGSVAGGQPRAWSWDLVVDQAGQPRAAFTVLRSRGDHRYWVASHDGDRWHADEVVAAGGTIAQDVELYYSGGIVLDPVDADIAVLSRRAGPGELHRVEQWRYATGDLKVLSGQERQNVRPCFVRGAPVTLPWRLMWLEGTYGDFKNYGTRIVAV